MDKKNDLGRRVIVEIMNRLWGVSVVPESYPRLLNSESLTDFKNREIYLSSKLSREKMKTVLFNEYSWVFCYELGCHSAFLLKINQESNKKIVDEIIKKLYPDDKLKLQRFRMKGRERE